METVANFIHGECVTGSGQRVQAIFNPATGEQIRQEVMSTAQETEQAIAAAQQADENAGTVWFLPYLSGERTPHNNPEAKGVFFGLTHQHGPAELARAVLEGVGYALADGMDVVHDCGLKPTSVTLIGGGARSPYWRQLLSDISGLQLDFRTGGDVGPALGAARLAQIAIPPEQPLSQLLPQLALEQAHLPDATRHARYAERRDVFRKIYQQLLPLMS